MEYLLLAGLVALGVIVGLSRLSSSKQGAFETIACQLLGWVQGASSAGCPSGAAVAAGSQAQTGFLPQDGSRSIRQVQDPVPETSGLGMPEAKPGPRAPSDHCSNGSCLNLAEGERRQAMRRGGSSLTLPKSVIAGLTKGLTSTKPGSSFVDEAAYEVAQISTGRRRRLRWPLPAPWQAPRRG